MARREPYDLSDGLTDREGSSMLGCPACAGVLAQRRDPGDDRMRRECTVGHRFSFESLLEAKEEQLEQAFWSAIVLLAHVDLIISHLRAQSEPPAFHQRLQQMNKRRDQVREQAMRVRRMLEETVRPDLGADV